MTLEYHKYFVRKKVMMNMNQVAITCKEHGSVKHLGFNMDTFHGEIHSLLDHYWSHFVIWATDNFVLLIF